MHSFLRKVILPVLACGQHRKQFLEVRGSQRQPAAASRPLKIDKCCFPVIVFEKDLWVLFHLRKLIGRKAEQDDKKTEAIRTIYSQILFWKGKKNDPIISASLFFILLYYLLLFLLPCLLLLISSVLVSLLVLWFYHRNFFNQLFSTDWLGNQSIEKSSWKISGGASYKFGFNK